MFLIFILFFFQLCCLRNYHQGNCFAQSKHEHSRLSQWLGGNVDWLQLLHGKLNFGRGLKDDLIF